VRRDIPGDDRSRPDQRIRADRDTADDRGVRADGRAGADDGRLEGHAPVDAGPWVANVGEHGGRPHEHRRSQPNAVIDGHIVLDATAVVDLGGGGNEDVLPQHAAFADTGATHDVGEVPDLRAGSDAGAPIDDRRRVAPVSAVAQSTPTGAPFAAIERVPASSTRTTASAWAPLPAVGSSRTTP
jgi:hypothetical protein